MKQAIGRVTGKEYKKNKDGTQIKLLLQVEVTSPEDIQTVELMSQTGEASKPPNDSKVVIVSIGEANKIAIASADAIEHNLEDGEKIIYSTSADGKTLKASTHYKNDGNIITNNGACIITAKPNGKVEIINSGITEITSAKTIFNNEVEIKDKLTVTGTIDSGYQINCPKIVINGQDYVDHEHTGSTTGPDNTGPVA